MAHNTRRSAQFPCLNSTKRSAAVLLTLLLSFASVAPFQFVWAQASTKADGGDPALQIPTKRGCADCKDTEQMIYTPLVDLPEASGSEVVFNCRSSHEMRVVPVFYTADGTAITGATVRLQPGEIRYVAVNNLIPAEYRREHGWGGMSLSYKGKLMEVWAQLALLGVNRAGSVDMPFFIVGDNRSNVQEAVWWSPRNGVAAIALGNSSAVSIRTTLRFADGESQEVNIAPFGTETVRRRVHHGKSTGVNGDSVTLTSTGPLGSLRATGLIASANGKFASSIRFYDTQNIVQPHLFASNLRIRNSEVHLMLRNTTEAEIIVQPRFRPASGEMGNPVELPAMTLGPREIVEVNLQPLMEAAVQRTDLNAVSVQVVNSGAPGSLIGSLYSIDEAGTAYDVPLRDSGNLRSTTGTYPWRIDGDYSTTVTITNVTEESAEFVAQLNYEGGRYVFEPRRLAIGETTTIDLRKLRDEQIPDANGNLLPRSVTTGQFRWSGRNHRGVTRLIGRAEMVSRSRRISISYSCGVRCPPYHMWGFMEPERVGLFTGDVSYLEAYEWLNDGYDGMMGPYAANGEWQSDNPNAVSTERYGYGEILAVGDGTARVSTSWYYDNYGFDGQDCLYIGVGLAVIAADITVEPPPINRGRLQAQGPDISRRIAADLNGKTCPGSIRTITLKGSYSTNNGQGTISWAWARNDGVSKTEALEALQCISDALPPTQRYNRSNKAFPSAARVISTAPATGIDAQYRNGWSDNGQPSSVRVDIEVSFGAAFVSF